jgi:hypothetical protein
LTALLAEKRVMILMPTNLSAEVEAALTDWTPMRCLAFVTSEGAVRNAAYSERVAILRTALERSARIEPRIERLEREHEAFHRAWQSCGEGGPSCPKCDCGTCAWQEVYKAHRDALNDREDG